MTTVVVYGITSRDDFVSFLKGVDAKTVVTRWELDGSEDGYLKAFVEVHDTNPDIIKQFEYFHSSEGWYIQ